MTQRAAGYGWILNLDAELELARNGPGYNPKAKLLRDLDRYAAASRELLGACDVLVGPGAPLQGLVGRAWCPTPSALSKLRAAGIEPEPYPPLSVLRRVNHRRFAFELRGGLPGQAYIEQRAELEALLRTIERPWLLKRPLTFAGRGQLRIHESIGEKQWAWIDASLRKDGLLLEPLVEPTLELSLHGFVWRDARYELGNICVQDVSPRGVFRSVRRARTHELDAGETQALLAQGERVAEALSKAGYFGPFGIDAYRYRTAAGSALCALGEINARYTMGFVTGFPRHPAELVLA